jgi:hypothetical protein
MLRLYRLLPMAGGHLNVDTVVNVLVYGDADVAFCGDKKSTIMFINQIA